METRPDTSSSSGRFRGQWSFLSQPSQHPRSHTPSSYILQSDRSSVSPHPTGVQYRTVNGSRSSLPRNLTTVSLGGKSVASTAPSQPVLLRINSAEASTHTHPAPRPRRPIKMNKNNSLPALSEFSIQGILSAIQEDTEQDINTISEILGRSRLVLADQHDSHMPPQGEIRATSRSLQAVEEGPQGHEQLLADDVFILRDDASLIAASHTGSAAYGLLERLQAVPRTDRMHSDWTIPSTFDNQPHSPMRHQSPPAVLSLAENHSLTSQEPQRTSMNLLQSHSGIDNANRSTLAPVFETHILAESDGLPSLMQSRSNFEMTATTVPHQTFDQDYEPTQDVEVPETFVETSLTDEQSLIITTFRERMQNLLYVSDPTGLSVWLQGQRQVNERHTSDAEGHLRELLERNDAYSPSIDDQ